MIRICLKYRFYAHQGCIYLIKSKNCKYYYNIIKYNLNVKNYYNLE